MSSLSPVFVRSAITLIVSALLATGCSSSSESDSSDTQPSNELADETSGDNGMESTPTEPDSVVGDSTRVDFAITVPAYVSEALQVELVWNAKDEPNMFVREFGQWVGDEFWTATGELQTDTAHDLAVTFFDRNGELTLGSVNTEFTTGINVSQSIQIEADQFDTNSWDADGDGVSNIDELIAGTDPSVDEATNLPVKEAYHDESIVEALYALRQVSESYELSIPTQRPYSENTERPPMEGCLSGDLGLPTARIIDIDESGTGSFFENYFCDDFGDVTNVHRIASRTSLDDSVMWAGTYERTNSSAGVYNRIGFTTESDKIDNQTYRQIGSITREFLQNYQATQDISYKLTGTAIEGTSQCEPVAGTITNDQNNAYVAITTITRQPGGQYWRVSVENDGQLVDEYQVQSLGTTFYCEFVN